MRWGWEGEGLGEVGWGGGVGRQGSGAESGTGEVDLRGEGSQSEWSRSDVVRIIHDGLMTG